MTDRLLLLAVVVLPFAAGMGCLYLGQRRLGVAIRVSVAAALTLVFIVSVAAVDIEFPLVAGRALMLKATGQLGIQLLGLAMLGFVMSLAPERAELLSAWISTAWLSVGGLGLALLVTSLPLAVLAFVASTLVWAFALPQSLRLEAAPSILRFAALLASVMPLLLIAFRLAESRSAVTPSVERMVLALAVPAFALLIGVFPLHAWALSLTSGTPREMLYGILLMVETAGFGLLLRTLATYPWIVGEARDALVVGGALSAVLGGWMALSAPRSGSPSWLVYAAVANSGMLLAGLGTRSSLAGAGVGLMLFARVLALMTLALAPRVEGQARRVANAAGTLALAGTPGLAGFPGFWLILRRLQSTDHWVAGLSLLIASGLLFATAVRRWHATDADPGLSRSPEMARSALRSIATLIVILVVMGLAPQWVAEAFVSSMRDLYFAVE